MAQSSATPSRISGTCHCGAIRFLIAVSAAVDLLDCNCSMCARTGFLHLIVPHADFVLESGGDALTSYRFGTGAAEHLFCKHCGIKSFYRSRSHPTRGASISAVSTKGMG